MKESMYRAFRTFLQTALGYLLVNIALVDFSCEKERLKSVLLGLLISAISAGIAAVMNVKKGDNSSEI